MHPIATTAEAIGNSISTTSFIAIFGIGLALAILAAYFSTRND